MYGEADFKPYVISANFIKFKHSFLSNHTLYRYEIWYRCICLHSIQSPTQSGALEPWVKQQEHEVDLASTVRGSKELYIRNLLYVVHMSSLALL